MKWKNALTDTPPEDGQVVVVSIDGVYYIATYNSAKKQFRVAEERELIFKAEEHLIYWTESQDH